MPEPLNIPVYRLHRGEDYPYDAKGPAVDWAHAAARGCLADLCDRGGVKDDLRRVDAETRDDIVASLAAIIREANKPGSEPPIVATAKTLRDEFAAAALTGILACPEHVSDVRTITGSAYQWADAMLKARG